MEENKKFVDIARERVKNTRPLEELDMFGEL